ncbi:sugar ABC transporter substrate-binding protein [Rhodococcus globerulus]|jgi:ribose transport system substrate-binding protein|uniref:sugar ABC transporter substrate-binding protein n=1 Tax=Rhodococcus globerulus TaxID=33008 RepID=UPI001F36ECC9|nr:substrate-binding domain-containing protein [Rhodococcus globerulus]MCE4267497.1 substrate-binding domain-containing protein [Rhodococcus globerulus]
MKSNRSFMSAARITVAVGALIVLGACSAGPPGGAGEILDSDVSAAQASVAHYEAVPEAPSDLTAFEPVTSKRIGIMSCGENITSCQKLSSAAKAAVEDLGWQAVMYDGTQDTSKWGAGIDLFIQNKVDAIVKLVNPDNAMPNAMDDAAAAGIPVFCGVCGNTNEKAVTHPSIGNADSDYGEQGEAVAAWVIADSGGSAKVLGINNVLATPVKLRHEKIVEAINACSGCELLEDTNVTQDANIYDKLRSFTTAKLSAYPTGSLNYIVPQTDALFDPLRQSLEATGRDDVTVAGFDCDEISMSSIRDGGVQGACADTPLEWLSYAVVDQAARHLSGQSTSNVLVPFQLFTSNNVPAEGISKIGFDYRSYYLQLWGRQG